MALNSYIGTEVAVADAAPATLDKSGFEGLTWVTVGQLQMVGEMGDTVNMIDVPVLSDSRVQRIIGSRDGGSTNLTVSYDETDAGQVKVLGTYAYSNIVRALRFTDGTDAGGKDWYITAIFADIRWGQRDMTTAFQYTAMIYPRMNLLGPISRG